MHRLALALVGEGKALDLELQEKMSQVVNARVVFSSNQLPARPDEATIRQLRDLEPEVVLVSIDSENPEPGLAAIRLLHSSLTGVVICAFGDLRAPHTVIRAIREGAVDHMRLALEGSDAKVPEDLRLRLPYLLWLYQMALIMFWLYDRSPDQERTRRLLDKSLALLVNLLRLSSLPLTKPLRKDLLKLMEGIDR